MFLFFVILCPFYVSILFLCFCFYSLLPSWPSMSTKNWLPNTSSFLSSSFENLFTGFCTSRGNWDTYFLLFSYLMAYSLAQSPENIFEFLFCLILKHGIELKPSTFKMNPLNIKSFMKLCLSC